ALSVTVMPTCAVSVRVGVLHSHFVQRVPEALEGHQSTLQRIRRNEAPVYTAHADSDRKAIAVDNAINTILLICDKQVKGVGTEIYNAYTVHKNVGKFTQSIR